MNVHTTNVLPFESVVEDVSGGNSKVQKGDYLPAGLYPVVDQGQEFVGGFSNDEGCLVKGEAPWIVFGDHTRVLKYVDFPFCMGADGVKVLKPRSEQTIDTKFLFHFLAANEVPSAGYSRHYKFLKRLEVPIPPLDQQRRIATILDKADALRRKRRHAIDLLDDLSHSIFLDMFGDPIQNPAGWRKITVGQALEDGYILEVQDGNHGERHPKVSDFVSEGVPFITANCLRSGALNIDDAYRLNQDWLSRLRVGFAQAGDFLLSHKGTVGEVAVVPATVGRAILSPQVTYYRLGPELDAHFLAGVFKTNTYQSLLANAAEQSTRAYIGLIRQRELPIILPPISNQREFASQISRVIKLGEQQRANIRTDAALLSSLQSRAFSGQL